MIRHRNCEGSGHQGIERGQRLAQVYGLLLRVAAQHVAADGGEFGDLAPSAANDAPALRPEHDV